MKKLILFILINITFFNSYSIGQNSPVNNNLNSNGNLKLKIKLSNLINPYKANIGIAVLGIEDRDSLTINNHFYYPMMSVYKFPLAIAVLNHVDKGKLLLNKKIHISKKDLKLKGGALRDRYPDGNIYMGVDELLNYSISHSDNNACDILFKLMNGTRKVEKYIHSLNIKDIEIRATEYEMSKSWNVQYKNRAKPFEMVKMLDNLFQVKYLTDSSSNLLIKQMTENQTSVNRIKGLLPKETMVAHKTGTSDTNDKGMTAAVNDIGIVTMPGGKHFAIAVFVSNSYENYITNEKIIAEITKEVYDYYLK
jgi:beta-lactamase class A